MKHEDRPAFVRAILDQYLLPVMAAKGPDYSRRDDDNPEADDVNNNFKLTANRFPRLDKYFSWGILFTKHMLAIEKWINNRKLLSEPLEGRLTDAINYLFILWSMLCDDGIVPWPQGFKRDKAQVKVVVPGEYVNQVVGDVVRSQVAAQ